MVDDPTAFEWVFGFFALAAFANLWINGKPKKPEQTEREATQTKKPGQTEREAKQTR